MRRLRLVPTHVAVVALCIAWLSTTPVAALAQADDEPAAETTPRESTKSKKPGKRPGYEFHEDHDPNGIGKFYMGREIAHVMGAVAVDWLERPSREAEEAVTQLVKSLQLQPGQVVADIGAGSGVLTLLMSEEVGETGKVVAVDVQQQMLDAINRKVKLKKITNVDTVRGTKKSPKLPDESVDLAIMVDVYHEFEFPYEMMLAMSKGIKPGGRVVFVEYRKEDPEVPIKLVHKMTEAQVKKEMALPELGLKWKETIETLPRQHIVIFEKTKDAS